MSDYKKFEKIEDEYAALLGLFVQPSINLDLQEKSSILEITSPSMIKLEQDFEYDVYVVTRLKLQSYYESVTGTYQQEDLLAAYKTSFDLVGTKELAREDFKSVSTTIDQEGYKQQLSELINVLARFNQKAGDNILRRLSVEDSCDQVLAGIYDNKHHWFKADEKPFGIYVKVRIKGNIATDGNDYEYTIPNELMKPIMDTEDTNKSDYDKLLMGDEVYVSKYEPSPLMQFATQDELKKELYDSSKEIVGNISNLKLYSLTTEGVKSIGKRF